jgi:hypothetical protein
MFIPKLFFYASLERDPATDPAVVAGTVRVELDGEQLLAGPVQLDFEGKSLARITVGFQGVVVPRAGILRVRLMHEQTALAEAVLPVVVQPQQLTLVTPTGTAAPDRREH